ncbi:MAG: putative dehydrogenase [Flavobacterium sp.]|jgi:predicted dehydrogenase
MINFGTLGAARITPPALIDPCQNDDRASVALVAARSKQRAEAFAKEHNIPTALDGYDEVIASNRITAIYNPLPINHHHEWTIKALRAGKHVLCEKSFASNAREAEEMLAVANETKLVLMDAFHYRYHPIFLKAKEIYDSGILGKIKSISSTFSVPVVDTNDIRMNYETAGGVTMDIGCYPLSWVRHITGLEPVSVEAVAEVGPANVDIYLETKMLFPGGIDVRTIGDMRPNTKFKAVITVEGEQGVMIVKNPIAPQAGNAIDLDMNGEITTETFRRRPTYRYQLDAFIDAVTEGKTLFTDAEDAVKQMQLIDKCYQAAGLPLRGLTL